MTRLPGDFPREGEARQDAVNERRLTGSRPESAPRMPYRIEDELRCETCGNTVRMERLGGGPITCCGTPMEVWHAAGRP